jgi:hypothetical protein
MANSVVVQSSVRQKLHIQYKPYVKPTLEDVFQSVCQSWLLTSSCLSVRPSVRMVQLDSHRADFQDIRHLSIFRKTVEDIPVPLQSANNNRTALYMQQTDIQL